MPEKIETHTVKDPETGNTYEFWFYEKRLHIEQSTPTHHGIHVAQINMSSAVIQAVIASIKEYYELR